ncbi:uncharacterized protein Tco025E_09030, partial [Trypanosoma conorhini]
RTGVEYGHLHLHTLPQGAKTEEATESQQDPTPSAGASSAIARLRKRSRRRMQGSCSGAVPHRRLVSLGSAAPHRHAVNRTPRVSMVAAAPKVEDPLLREALPLACWFFHGQPEWSRHCFARSASRSVCKAAAVICTKTHVISHHGLGNARALRAAKGPLTAAPFRRVVVCKKCGFTTADREAFWEHMTPKHAIGPPPSVNEARGALAAPRPTRGPPLRAGVHHRVLQFRCPICGERCRMQGRLSRRKCPQLRQRAASVLGWPPCVGAKRCRLQNLCCPNARAFKNFSHTAPCRAFPPHRDYEVPQLAARAMARGASNAPVAAGRTCQVGGSSRGGGAPRRSKPSAPGPRAVSGRRPR